MLIAFFDWMMMRRLPTVRQLQHFLALAETRHFGQAAEKAGVTQSTLSASIAELEQSLGAAVADRSGKKLLLTPLGELVQRRAERVLVELAELVSEARTAAKPLSGVLRLGVIPTISPYLLPRLLPSLRAKYDALKLYLREDVTENLLRGLEAGELDVLLLALPCRPVNAETAFLLRDAFHVAFRPDHPLAERDDIVATELQPHNLLLLQDGHCLTEHALAACGLGEGRRSGYAATSLPTLVQMVDNGLGITLLPEMAIRAGILTGTSLLTRPLANGAARDIALMWRKGSARHEEFSLLAHQLSIFTP